MIRGFVLGKFLPPHRGHVYLVEFASRMCDDLTVVVGSLAREPIPGALRAAWMQELFPRARVVHLDEELPQYPEEHPQFWDLWRTALLRVLPAGPDVVFASEPYGERLAVELGGRFIPVDLARTAVPMSGTRVREDPLGNWEYLPRPVRPYFARRVSIFGPESTGKTTLAARLAAHYRTVWVPEYARTLLLSSAAPNQLVVPAHLPLIARGQAASEEALARDANRLLVCDTDPLATVLWSEALFGAVDPEVTTTAAGRRYDLTLLLDADVPFVPDPVRYLPAERAAFFTRAHRALDDAGRPTVVLRGTWEERFEAAVSAIDSLLARR